MKTTCQHCQCCYSHNEVSNAHTVFEKKQEKVTFSSVDDDFGIDICQVCHKPPFVASLWHKIWKNPSHSELNIPPDIYPEVAVAIL